MGNETVLKAFKGASVAHALAESSLHRCIYCGGRSGVHQAKCVAEEYRFTELYVDYDSEFYPYGVRRLYRKKV